MSLASSTTYGIAASQVLHKMKELESQPNRWEALATWVDEYLRNDE